MKKILIALLSALMIMPMLAPAALADTRCNGKMGVQVWQDSAKGDPSFITCTDGTLPNPQYSNLSNVTFGLGFGANWNDRITSVQLFNACSTCKFRLYPNTGFSDYTGYARYVTLTGNTYVSCLCVFWTGLDGFGPNGFNDRASSMRWISS